MSRLPSLRGLGGLPSLSRVMRPTAPGQPNLGPEYTDEEQQSFLGSVASSGLSALELVGNVLDTPGGMVRDLLAGDNPFQNVFNPSERTTGRELLTMAGITKRNRPGLHFNDASDLAGDVAGFGAEVLLDPMLLLTGPTKAVTKLGAKAGLLKGVKMASEAGAGVKIAKEFGKYGSKATGRNISRLIEEVGVGERALVGLQLPFTKRPFATFGTGERAANVLEKVAYAPGVRQARQVFSAVPGMKFSSTRDAQIVADRNYARMGDLVDSSRRQLDKHFGQMNEIEGVWENGLKNYVQAFPDEAQQMLGEVNLKDITFDDFMRTLIEAPESGGIAGMPLKKPTAADFLARAGKGDSLVFQGKTADTIQKMRESADWVNGSTTMKDVADRMDTIVTDAIELKDSVFAEGQRLGLPAAMLGDELLDHYPRRVRAEFQEAFGKRIKGNLFKRSAGPFSRYMLKRADQIRGIPTKAINDMTQDDVLMSTVKLLDGKAKVGSTLPERYAGMSAAEQAEQFGIAEGDDIANYFMNTDELQAFMDKELAMPDARAVGDVTASYADVPEPIKRLRSKHLGEVYDIVDEEVTEGIKNTQRISNVDGWLYEMPMKGIAERAEIAQGGLFGQDILTNLNEYTKNMLDRTQGTRLALDWMAKAAVNDLPGGRTLTEMVGGAGLNENAVKYIRDLGIDPDKMFVPDDMGQIVKSMIEFKGKGEMPAAILDTFDKTMALWKGAFTMPFPAFHVRNLVSGMWQNAVSIFPANPANVARSYQNAFNAMRGKKVMAGGYDIVREAKAYNLLPEGGMQAADIAGPLLSAAPVSIENLGGDLARTVTSPKSLLSPIESGSTALNYVEGMNRLSAFSSLLEQGVEPSAAAIKVMKNHFDYAALASSHPLQAKMLKRVIPFYTFARYNMPKQIMDLVMQPGARQAQTVRLYENVRREAKKVTWLPKYMQEALAVPLSKDADGRQNVLRISGLLPLDEAFGPFQFKRGDGGMASPDVMRTMQKFGQRLNPILSFMVEQATGTELFSGRQLEELRKGPTGNFWMDRIISKTPLKRGLDLLRDTAPDFIGKNIEELVSSDVYNDKNSTSQKAINFILGGVKATDFDPVVGARIEAQKVIEERLKFAPGVRTFSRIFVKDPDELTPEQLRLQSLYKYLISRSRSK